MTPGKIMHERWIATNMYGPYKYKYDSYKDSTVTYSWNNAVLIIIILIDFK